MSGRRYLEEAKVVLDASALIAWVNGERGGHRVEPLLQVAAVSVVNMAEVLAWETRGLEPDPRAVRERFRAWRAQGLRLAEFTADDAVRTAELAPLTQPSGLSLGDRACLALGMRLRLPVWTAEALWSKLSLPVSVRLVRERH